MDMDLDLTEIELDTDIVNLKLLQKQLHSVQTIRYEQQRKDELINRLKEKIRHLESESRSYEDIKEHVMTQSRHVMKMRDKEMDARLGAMRQQMEALSEQVQNSEAEHNATKKRLEESNSAIEKYHSKLFKCKKIIEEEISKTRALQGSLDDYKRVAVEKEAALSMEIHEADQLILQLKAAIQDKRADFEEYKNSTELKESQVSAKAFEDVRLAKEEAVRWKNKYEDLDTSTRNWRQFSESALSHEKVTSSQLQDTCNHLRKENEENTKMFNAEISERNSMINELRQIVQSTSDELSHLRESHAQDIERITQDRNAQIAEQEGDLQKEIGALQVGLCLQKEMKDRLQQNMNHLKSCLRSLALDLTRSFDKHDEAATKTYFSQLVDLFNRLLVSGALVDDEVMQMGHKSSQSWEQHVSHMHSYINKHSDLVSNLNNTSSSTVSQYGKSLNIDSDFLSIVKSMKELLAHVLQQQSSPSQAARKEITRLVEHIQLLKSDLEQSDLLMYSLVNQLMDEGFVDASSLRDNFEGSGSVLESFDPVSGNLIDKHIKFHSGSKQRAVLHAKLCTGVAEAIRSAKVAANKLKKEQDEIESITHELDILKMKCEIDNRQRRESSSPSSPASRSPNSKYNVATTMSSRSSGGGKSSGQTRDYFF